MRQINITEIQKNNQTKKKKNTKQKMKNITKFKNLKSKCINLIYLAYPNSGAKNIQILKTSDSFAINCIIK